MMRCLFVVNKGSVWLIGSTCSCAEALYVVVLDTVTSTITSMRSKLSGLCGNSYLNVLMPPPRCVMSEEGSRDQSHRQATPLNY